LATFFLAVSLSFRSEIPLTTEKVRVKEGEEKRRGNANALHEGGEAREKLSAAA